MKKHRLLALKNRGFNELQIWYIEDFTRLGVDVSRYIDTKFSEWQMNQIFKGLKAGVDVSTYAKPEFDFVKMERLRRELFQKAGIEEW